MCRSAGCGCLLQNRPFFLPPVLAPRRVHRGEVIVEETVVQVMPFMIDNSIFSRRRTEAEGRSYFDAGKVYAKRLEVDWGNAITKTRFQTVMAKADDDGAGGLKEEIDEVSRPSFVTPSRPLQLSIEVVGL
jgi:hypothetical protein